MLRKGVALLFVAGGLIMLTPAVASAKTKDVGIGDSGIGPANVRLGWAVHWENVGVNDHTSTSFGTAPGTVGLALWDSGQLAPNGTFDFVFSIAGTFPYRDEDATNSSSLHATVAVKPHAGPKTGPIGPKFKIHISQLDTPPAGMVYDVQIFHGSWEDYRVGVTTPQVVFKTPPGTDIGSYYFRSRLRRTADDVTSDWSPQADIFVTYRVGRQPMAVEQRQSQ